MMDQLEQRSMHESIARTDFVRRPPRDSSADPLHREWLHFSVSGASWTLVLNFSITDDARSSSRRGRLVALLRTEGGWEGDVVELGSSDVDATPGEVFMRLGQNLVEFRDGAFVVTGELQHRELAFDLRLKPESFPSMANNVSLGAGRAPINWVVVPRLRATGTVQLGQRRLSAAGASAYHDHNWGYFGQRDFAWQWGHAWSDQPGAPETVVFTRLLNGNQTFCFMQALLLWTGVRQDRVMREDEVNVHTEGRLRIQPFAVPRRARLLAEGTSVDIPRTVHIRSSGNDDWLNARFDAEDAAQIIVPNDDDLGTTLINEVVGKMSVEGQVRGRAVSFDGRAVFEFLGRGS